MCVALNQPKWLDDDRFNTPMGRVTNAKERIDSMGEVLKSRTSEDWLERLDANDVPCAPVLSRAEILENEQIKANKLIEEYEHPGLGLIRQARPGATFSRSSVRHQPVAPGLGEHSDEILRDLGLSNAEIKGLLDEGIVMPPLGESS